MKDPQTKKIIKFLRNVFCAKKGFPNFSPAMAFHSLKFLLKNPENSKSRENSNLYHSIAPYRNSIGSIGYQKKTYLK